MNTQPKICRPLNKVSISSPQDNQRKQITNKQTKNRIPTPPNRHLYLEPNVERIHIAHAVPIRQELRTRQVGSADYVVYAVTEDRIPVESQG